MTKHYLAELAAPHVDATYRGVIFDMLVALAVHYAAIKQKEPSFAKHIPWASARWPSGTLSLRSAFESALASDESVCFCCFPL